MYSLPKRSHSDGFAVFPPDWPLVAPQETPSLSQGSSAAPLRTYWACTELFVSGWGQVDSLLPAGREEGLLPKGRAPPWRWAHGRAGRSRGLLRAVLP